MIVSAIVGIITRGGVASAVVTTTLVSWVDMGGGLAEWGRGLMNRVN